MVCLPQTFVVVPQLVELTRWAVQIGSDNQTVSLQLDTGSPLTWVNPDCSKMPDRTERERASCFKRPRYNPFTSTTAHIRDQSFNNTYGTGSILGSYFTDNIKIGSLVAKNALFGVAAATRDIEAGILGVGAKPDGYPETVMETLTSQGQIKSHVYSIDLKSINETGTLHESKNTASCANGFVQ